MATAICPRSFGITEDRLRLHPEPVQQRIGSGVIICDHMYMVDESHGESRRGD